MEEGRSRTLLERLSATVWMRRDWDRRARENAQRFIACGHSETDSAFWSSGRRDLEATVLRDVELASEARALEIGCGTGRLLRPLSERVAKAFGTDISGEMVERARIALADRPNVEVFRTRGNLAGIPAASLDFVFSFIVFQHIPKKKAISRYIREAARVLKGNGVFRFQVDGRPRPAEDRADTWLGVWYEARELHDELDRAGFDTVGIWGERTHYLWATARRKEKRGRVGTSAARARSRSWNRAAVEGLIIRLGYGRAESDSVIFGTRSLRELADRFLDEQETTSADQFVRRAYEVLLGRDADPDGLAFYRKEIEAGITPSNTVDCLLSSSELQDQLRPVDRPAGQ